MALTPSNMLPLGTKAPDFSLPDTVSGTIKSLTELKSTKATVIMFICNHCPFVQHIQDQLVQVVNEFIAKGINFIAISSNDVKNYPEDSPEKMAILAIEKKFSFPYLYDETQAVAKSYDAACTPDFYVFDADLKCIYRGQFDDSRPGNDMPVTGNDLSLALNAILANKPVSADQKPSVGCNIKWK